MMDYNPTDGDTMSGFCKIVNTQGNDNSNNKIDGIPTVTLPDSGETGSSTDSSSSSSSSPIIPGTTIGVQ